MPTEPAPRYEFGPFVLEVGERRLLREGKPIALTDKVFELLLVLVENAGHALGKRELMARLWPDAVVEESNLTVNVSLLRKALGDSGSERRYIETLARRGYRFVADVQSVAAEGGARSTRALPALQSTAHGERAGRAAPPTTFGEEPEPLPFVGREPELARLSALLERALAGRGRLVLVTGDAGMGKTELCDEFLRRARAAGAPISVARGRCLEHFGSTEAYLPFLEALQGLLGGPEAERVARALLRHAPSWCALLPALSGQIGTGEAGYARGTAPLLRELPDAFEALCRERPMVVLLEDLHWADPSSADLLHRLALSVARFPMLVLGTLRDEPVELEGRPLRNVRRELVLHDACDELPLALFDEEQVARYLSARFPEQAFPPELAGVLLGTTEGQPLFLSRWVELLLERGDIVRREGLYQLARPLSDVHVDVPANVRALIERKLDALDEPARRTLQYASAIGVEFGSSTLARLLGEDEVLLDERLDHLARLHRMLSLVGEERLPSGRISVRYRFAHVLYHDVLHAGLASRRRMALHAGVAEALVAEHAEDTARIAPQLVQHYREARDFARAVRYAIVAADNEASKHANREARQYCDDALALLPELPAHERLGDELVLLYDVGWIEFKLGNYERSLDAFRELVARAASELAGHGEAAARARARVFEYLSQPWGDVYGAGTMARMPNQDPSFGAAAIQCEAYWALVYILGCLARFDEMGALLAEYLRLAEETHNEPRRTEALAWMATRELELGDLARARAVVEECIPAARALGHARALFVALFTRAALHYLQSEYAAAIELYEESLTGAFEASGHFDCLIGRGTAQAALGRFDAALADYQRALDVARRSEQHDAVIIAENALGDLHLELGDREAARACYERARALAERHGRSLGEKLAHLNALRVQTALGALAAASDALVRLDHSSFDKPRELMPCVQVHREWLGLRLPLAKAELALAQGDRARAQREAEAALQLARAEGSAHYVALAREAQARIALAEGDDEGAARLLQSGLDALAAHPAPLVELASSAALAQIERRAGNGSAAADALARARALADTLSAAIGDDALRACFEATPAVKLVRDARDDPAPTR